MNGKTDDEQQKMSNCSEQEKKNFLNLYLFILFFFVENYYCVLFYRNIGLLLRYFSQNFDYILKKLLISLSLLSLLFPCTVIAYRRKNMT